MKVTVSGKTYDNALNPGVSNVPGEIGLPVPTPRRRGRGWQLSYVISPEVAENLLDHLLVVGSSFAAGDDPETRADGRAILRDARRLGADLGYEDGEV